MSNPTTATTTTPATDLEYVHRAAWKAGVMGAINVAAALLAARLILLVAVGGAISLAYLAMGAAGPYTMGALTIYCAVVVVPLVWLAVHGR